MKLLLIAISFFLISAIATAVCLKDHPSVAEEYTDSKTVFVGKVIEIIDVAELFIYYDGQICTVQVQEVFKGNPTKSIAIFSENSNGRFPMVQGVTYLIFAYYELGRYQINNCGNSGILSNKEDTVLEVQSIKQNKANKK